MILPNRRSDVDYDCGVKLSPIRNFYRKDVYFVSKFIEKNMPLNRVTFRVTSVQSKVSLRERQKNVHQALRFVASLQSKLSWFSPKIH